MRGLFKIKRVVFIAALLFAGCAGKKPDICERHRIGCINECNNSLCFAKCEQKYQECIKDESLNNIGSFVYDFMKEAKGR